MKTEKAILYGISGATLYGFYYGGKHGKGLMFFALILILAYVLLTAAAFDSWIYKPGTWFGGPKESKIPSRPSTNFNTIP